MSRRKHILIICNEYPSSTRVGGIGRFSKTLTDALVKNSYQCTIIGLYSDIDSDQDYYQKNGVRVVKLVVKRSIPGFGFFWGKIRLSNCIKKINEKDKIDLIEAPDYEGSYWLLKDIKVPKVVRLHGSETYFRTILKERLKWIHKIIEKKSILKANAIISVSDYTLKETLKIFNIKKESYLTSTIYNPIDISYVDKVMDKLKEKTVKNRILYTGTFIRKKGVIDLFKSLEYVFHKIDDAHIICVGPDSHDIKTNNESTFEVAMKILSKKYHDRVKFLGPKPHGQLLKNLMSASVCVYPSYLEAYPLSWLEAMSMSKPIVASNTGSGREVIDDGESGFLCHPKEHEKMAKKIIKILKNDKIALKLGSQARYEVENSNNIDTLIKKNIDFFHHVMDNFENG